MHIHLHTIFAGNMELDISFKLEMSEQVEYVVCPLEMVDMWYV